MTAKDYTASKAVYDIIGMGIGVRCSLAGGLIGKDMLVEEPTSNSLEPTVTITPSSPSQNERISFRIRYTINKFEL